MNFVIKRSVLLYVLIILSSQVYAQNTGGLVILGISNIGAYSAVERSDWRRYDNGRYTGLVRNEVVASILPQSAGINYNADNSFFYKGNFFVLQSTLRDMRHSAQAVDTIISVNYEITRNGEIEIENDQGYPMLRGFPSFPNQGLTRGVKWRSPGKRAVDPLNKGQAVVIPFTAEYEYRGTEIYNNVLVHRVYAMYGYNFRNDNETHPYQRVTGSHKVDILIRAADGLTIFMRDDLNVTYTLIDKSTTEFRGFTLTFNNSITQMDKETVIESLEDIIIIDDTPSLPDINDSNIELTPVPEGIKLTIKNIQFAADSAQIIASEIQRLDILAQALNQIPDRTFLVEGHTASTGQAANEMQLSIERAQSIINELVKRGISANRFIYKGWGGTKPIGDNATDSGRSANRRVEITILE